jgi:hypothetical protein
MERRMVRIWRAGDQLPYLSATSDGHSRGRLTLEHVEANAPQSVNVGVVDLGEKADLGRGHGVVVREEQLELEDAAWMMSVPQERPSLAPDSPSYGDCEGPSIVTSK